MKVINNEQLLIAVEYLKQGKIVVFPTETSYGLGCDAANQNSVNKIFKIKGRTKDKPLLVVAPSVEMAKKYLVWNNTIDRLAKLYWPGPLTVVGQVKNKSLAKGVAGKDNTVAVRVTAHTVLKFLSEKLGRPVVATSANLSGVPVRYDAKEVMAAFAGKKWQPDFILDYGTLPKNLPSTIVSAVNDKLKILRQGELKIQRI